MEYQKIINLLDDATNPPDKCITLAVKLKFNFQ